MTVNTPTIEQGLAAASNRPVTRRLIRMPANRTDGGATGYSEKIATGTGLICDPGHELIASFLNKDVTVPI